ncbi:MAG: hypothetical protein AYL30_002530 [Candidatus Hecatellales archaeon B24]|nr:MAG: hypothetical protein AYL30_002530 [Candidatus Hecatellales archaeon B24]
MTSNRRSLILQHYSNPKVQREIADYSTGRWVAIHCDKTDDRGRKILVRYQGKARRPLRIDGPSSVLRLIENFQWLMPRSIHATANLYRKLESEEDVAFIDNIAACTPTWDIDNELEAWKATREAAREIVRFLSENGVSESVYVKFSGRGAHVQVHPYAFSPEVRARHNPLDLAYALVEYVRGKLQPRFVELAVRLKAQSLRVDNEMDFQRLFVCPLSVHRNLDLVAVCLDPENLDDFAPEEARLGRVKRHWEGWRSHRVGEADRLAVKAYNLVGGYPGTYGRPRRRRHPPLEKQIWSFLQKAEEA